MRWEQRIVCGLDKRTNSAGMKTLQMIVSKSNDLTHLSLLIGLLSSRLINFWCVNYLTDDINKSYLKMLPVGVFNYGNPTKSSLVNEIILSVESILKNKISLKRLNRQQKEVYFNAKSKPPINRLMHLFMSCMD